MTMFFAKNIKFLRESRGKTQMDVAHAIGIESHQTIGKYEKGKILPPINQLAKISEFFDVPLKELMFSDLSSENVPKPIDQEEFEKALRSIDRLDKALMKKEQWEKELKETPGALDELRKIAPELVKKLEQN